MEYQVLARKWRPKTFADLIGQEQVSRTLTNAIELKRLAHAYLFTGVRGVGKTSSARILARALNCAKGPTATPCDQCQACKEIASGHFMDVLEIDAASNTGVDDVRTLQENIQYLPTTGKYKIYIIDEVHMLSKSAFNALLKTLEEPPAGVIFILATTEPHKLPDTILSRCQRYDFKRVAAEVVAKHLAGILKEEGIQAPEGLLLAIARESQGSVRDALTLMDRLISHCGKVIEEKQARELLGLVDRQVVFKILQAISECEARASIENLHQIYYAGFDLKQFLETLMQTLRTGLLGKIGLNAQQIGCSPEELTQTSEALKAFNDMELERLFELTKLALVDLSRSDHELFLLETTLIKMCRVKSDFVVVAEALRFLKASAATSTKTGERSGAERPQETPHETIEDSYVKSTVGLFGAKVEKIQIGD